ncbi:Hypothetical predicted protein, partial [Paramuricea clavata]
MAITVNELPECQNRPQNDNYNVGDSYKDSKTLFLEYEESGDYCVNSSLINGYFPTDWKEALVKPLLKNPGLAALFNHLRPISNLQFISKLVERAVYDQIYDHLMLHDLFPEYQSAYRQGYSTETALLKVQNDILLNMDCQQVTLLVLLDLSAAFDTVDHSILLHRLETSFGITGTVRKWFESYLSGRCQRIAFKDGISDIFPLTCGVPQASCLGPLLFTMYASKLFDVIKEHLPTAHAYADDTQLYLSFKPGNGASEEESIAAMETCIKAVRTWMTKDKLKLNDKYDSKTEFLIIGTRQQLKKVNIVSLPVGDVNITPVASARNLGTVFDSNLCLPSTTPVPEYKPATKETKSQISIFGKITRYLRQKIFADDHEQVSPHYKRLFQRVGADTEQHKFQDPGKRNGHTSEPDELDFAPDEQ